MDKIDYPSFLPACRKALCRRRFDDTIPARTRPLTPAAAIAQVNEWLAAPVSTILQPSGQHWELVRELLLALGTAGNLTTDVHLAALAIERGATLVSCDTDFARFKRLKWENPAAIP